MLHPSRVALYAPHERIRGHRKRWGERHPIYMSDIEPLRDGVRCAWGGGRKRASLFISGSKTDWLNQGATRSHRKLDPEAPNKHLCVVSALQGLYQAYPDKFRMARDTPFATWRNGNNIPGQFIAATLRTAAFKHGYKAESYSLHSLRAGGATSLYRATRDIELVARFGRWRAASISSYIWESDQAMEGLSARMLEGGHTLHVSTKGNVARAEKLLLQDR